MLFSFNKLGDNCIQFFHLGWYIVGYTVGNFVLRRRVSGAVKHDFRPYIRRYTTPNEKYEYCYPHSNVLFKVSLYFQSILYVKNIFLGYKFRAKMVPKHGHYNSHLRALI